MKIYIAMIDFKSNLRVMKKINLRLSEDFIFLYIQTIVFRAVSVTSRNVELGHVGTKNIK